MKKILIADDEEHIRTLVATTIGLGQYDVIEASDGEEALNMAKSEAPDLMLLDVGMPMMIGFEVCKKLKSDPSTASIYIIMLTSFVQEEDKQLGRDAGANDYFEKPFSPTALLDKIAETLKDK